VNIAKADNITSMIFTFFKKLTSTKKKQSITGNFTTAYLIVPFKFTWILKLTWLFSFSTTGFSAGAANPDLLLEAVNYELQPQAFSESYFGLIVNQNHPWSYGQSTWAKGGPSFGGEYRFFYKDSWTVSISGEFKQLSDLEGKNKALLIGSQESMKLVRLYHPLYLGVGGKFSNYSPVKAISFPYERDDTRAVDNGVSLCVSALWISTPRTAVMLTASRWRSLSTTKRQGIELALSTLYKFR
jgi:hypothetical protein